MSGKERTSLRLLVLMKIFHDSPGYGNTIVGGCSTTQLIEEHQRTGRHIVQDVGSLRHLYHEGRFAQRDVVTGSHTGEDLIHQTHPCTLGRNKAAHLGQQHDERRLAEQGRFTRHVRTRNHHHLLLLGIEQHIIWHVSLAQRQLGFNHRMAALLDVQHLRIINNRAHIVVFV